jgi:hypothetical protein
MTFLDGDQCLKAGMPIRSTMAWYAHLVDGRPMLFRRPLATMDADKSIRPTITKKPKKGAEDADEKLYGAWRTAYRTLEPEKQGFNLSALARNHKSVESLPMELASRRKSWSMKSEGFEENKRRRQVPWALASFCCLFAPLVLFQRRRAYI